MPIYEIKYHGRSEWEKTSEAKVLGTLHEFFDPITPVIQEMIDGKQVSTPDAAFRIRGFDPMPIE
jgi:hypothetical protein